MLPGVLPRDARQTGQDAFIARRSEREIPVSFIKVGSVLNRYKLAITNVLG
jgi:hypothetical protein